MCSRQRAHFLSLLALAAAGAALLHGCHRSGSGSQAFRLQISEVMANGRPDLIVDREDSRDGAILRDDKGAPLWDFRSESCRAASRSEIAPFVDPAGCEAVDWVEIYNPGKRTVNLSEYTLSDDRDEPRYRFPAGMMLGPGEFLVVICDGQGERGPLHADFRLQPAGETVYLRGGADGRTLVDQLTYVDAPSNVAAGRFPEGDRRDPDWIEAPSPGATNHPSGDALPRVVTFEANAAAGEVLVTVTVSADDPARNGFPAAAVQAAVVDDCGDRVNPRECGPDSVERGFSDCFDLFEDPDQRTEAPPEIRTDPAGNRLERTVQRLVYEARIPGDAIDGFRSDATLRFRIRLEDAVGVAIDSRCESVGGETPTLVINEFQPRNVGTILFNVVNAAGVELPDPRSPDWLEIYNHGEERVSLEDLGLTGFAVSRVIDAGIPEGREICPPHVPGEEPPADCLPMWYFTSVGIDTLAPGEFLLVLADNDNPPFRTYFRQGDPEPRRPFYSTHFAISGRDEDAIVLYDLKTLTAIDRAEFDFSTNPPPLVDPTDDRRVAADTSFIRFPDGSDSGSPLLPGQQSVCPTPGGGNLEECEIAIAFDDHVWVEPQPGSGFGRICPTALRDPEVFTFLSIDQDTAAAETPGAPTFAVEFTYRVGDREPVTVTRQDGLSLEPVTQRLRDCYRPTPLPGTVMFRVAHSIPHTDLQPAPGTLVTFSFRAEDLQLGGEAEVPTAETQESSFRYLVDYQKPEIIFSEIFPDNEEAPEGEGALAELYPEEIRDDENFRAPEYAELFNASDVPVDIGGMFLAQTRDRFDTAGLFCAADIIDNVREFPIPEGTAIPPGEFLTLLFVREKDLNTEPDLEGTALEGRSLLVRDALRLSDCTESLFLISGDDEGNCQVALVRWDFRPDAPSDCEGPRECRKPLGRLDGGAPVVDGLLTERNHLNEPTPGLPNLAPAAPALEGELGVTVLGATGPGDCLERETEVRLEWVTLAAERGIESVEIIIEKDGSPEPALPIESFPEHILERDDPAGSPPCQSRWQVAVQIPTPADALREVRYRIRITDAHGTSAELDPVSFPICLAAGVFIRGDANGDGKVNLTDVVQLNRFLLGADPLPSCQDRIDVNDDGRLDEADRTYLIEFLQLRGPIIPPPFPLEGIDRTPDDLPCP